MQYRVKIYQINSDRDKNRVIFAGSDYLMKNEPALNIDASIYDEVFSGELDTKEPEKLFAQFNLERHPLHRGHSMSVSDVIVTEDGAFFCDSVGFKRNHAKKSSVIFFLCQNDAAEKDYCCCEARVSNGKVYLAQCRMAHNAEPEESVLTAAKDYCKVLNKTIQFKENALLLKAA